MMNVEQAQIDSKLSPHEFINEVVCAIGSLEDWEKEQLEATPCVRTCYRIAEKQTTIPRLTQWLKLGVERGDEHSMIPYATLLHALNPNVEYMGDEAALWISRVKGAKSEEYDEDQESEYTELVGAIHHFDSSGHRARRSLTRLLLSGSLSKNQDSVLHRSFFRSGLRENHVLPLISKYLVGERSDLPEVDREDILFLSSMGEISRTILCDYSYVTSMRIKVASDNQNLCFLPLLFSHLPNLDTFQIGIYDESNPKIDLSYLLEVNTSKLTDLRIKGCYYDSLSPLSLCDLSSFHTLEIWETVEVEGFHPLNGLSSEITRNVKMLRLFRSHTEDICPLSHCDLSSIEKLAFDCCPRLSDLSPLRSADLSSLKALSLRGTDFSDLSLLSECNGLALEDLALSRSSVVDLSPLSLLDLSRLKEVIDINHTEIADLSPLENISCDGVEIHIHGTPALMKMKEEGLEPPQTIGKVTVIW